MQNDTRYLLVDVNVLPEVFAKVVEAKRLLAQGKAKSYSEAAKLAGISRSAFYKYKDAVYVHETGTAQKICTWYVTLLDEPGALSALLAEIYRIGANILTVNQNLPVDGVAPVSITARLDRAIPDEELMNSLGSITSVVDVRTVTQ